ncbi:GDSL-type esterase/lipase family protein [Butyrivibrio sp. FC2001]|uniref:GDSL-type esterase/lipase family protein n=1 Tax=Butyrivibrio sp. FC2001 TaxID=1280671 RepID=UPI00040B5BBA|nr:GDSL-type esterase/lipase family protein [Butyrivibrio sp. FC2001]
MKWLSTFKYLKIGYGENIALADNLTQRVSFDNNVDADRVRVRFTNRYSKNELRIAKATITKEGASKISSITLDGKEEIKLGPDEVVFSDEVDYKISAGDRLVISIYYKDRQEMDSICCFWSDGGAEVNYYEGDVTEADENSLGASKGTLPEITSDILRDDANIGMMKIFSGFDIVQALADDDTKVIAAFGDSITHMSFYTNALQKRLYKAYPGKLSLINCGIGGNRLVDDATYVKAAGKQLVLFGKAGVDRFEEDVFGIDEVDTVLTLIGINDIMHPLFLEDKEETTSGEDIVNGYKKIAALAHDNGAEIYFGTITPCGNDEYPDWWLPKFEASRNKANEWIRSGELIDGFFDFDKELRNDNKPGYMKDDCNIGDGLHPNTEGGRRMADLVDIKAIVG